MSNVNNVPSATAKEALRRQQKVSTVVSLITALLIIALIGIILGIIMMVTEKKEIPTIVSYNAFLEDEVVVEKQKLRTNVSRKPSSPNLPSTSVMATTSVMAGATETLAMAAAPRPSLASKFAPNDLPT